MSRVRDVPVVGVSGVGQSALGERMCVCVRHATSKNRELYVAASAEKSLSSISPPHTF